MGKAKNQAIFVPDKYRTDNYLLEDLVSSLKPEKIVVDGWYLPARVNCLLEHLLTGEVLKYEPLHWSDLKLPDFFDLVYDEKEDVAKISSMGKFYGTVYFQKNLDGSDRLVDMVIWEDGTYKHIDYYYGKFCYLTEYMDENGSTLLSTYYSQKDGSSVVEIYDKVGAAVSYGVSQGENLQFIGAGSIRNVFQESATCKEFKLEEYKNLLPSVTHPKKVLTRDVLVYTETDQILGINTLVESLPYYNFHIAATTQVSEKLAKLNEFPNAKVYPNISSGSVKELYGICSVYLDLTAIPNEVNVREAIKSDMLIISSSETCSGRRYVADGYYFEGTGQEICQNIYDKLVAIAPNFSEGVNLEDERFLRLLY